MCMYIMQASIHVRMLVRGFLWVFVIVRIEKIRIVVFAIYSQPYTTRCKIYDSIRKKENVHFSHDFIVWAQTDIYYYYSHVRHRKLESVQTLQLIAFSWIQDFTSSLISHRKKIMKWNHTICSVCHPCKCVHLLCVRCTLHTVHQSFEVYWQRLRWRKFNLRIYLAFM